MSYLSSVWLPISDMENDKNTRARIRRFLEKPLWDTQWSEEEPYNPSYAKAISTLIHFDSFRLIESLTKVIWMVNSITW